MSKKTQACTWTWCYMISSFYKMWIAAFLRHSVISDYLYSSVILAHYIHIFGTYRNIKTYVGHGEVFENCCDVSI